MIVCLIVRYLMKKINNLEYKARKNLKIRVLDNLIYKTALDNLQLGEEKN